MLKVVSYQKPLGPQPYLLELPSHRWILVPRRLISSSQHVVNISVSFAKPVCDQIITLQRAVNHSQVPRYPNLPSLLQWIISQKLNWPFSFNHLGQGDLILQNNFFIKFNYQKIVSWHSWSSRHDCTIIVLKTAKFFAEGQHDGIHLTEFTLCNPNGQTDTQFLVKTQKHSCLPTKGIHTVISRT